MIKSAIKIDVRYCSSQVNPILYNVYMMKTKTVLRKKKNILADLLEIQTQKIVGKLYCTEHVPNTVIDNH